MIEIEYKTTLNISGEGDLDKLAANVDQIMDEMLKLEESDCGIKDTALSLDIREMTLIVECLASGRNLSEAATCASSAIRAAVHAAGGATHGWDYNSHEASQRRLEEYA